MAISTYKEKNLRVEDPVSNGNLGPENLDPRVADPEGFVNPDGASSEVLDPNYSELVDESDSEIESSVPDTFKSEVSDVDVKSRMEQIKKDAGTEGAFETLSKEPINGNQIDALKKAEVKDTNSNQTAQDSSNGVASRVALFGYVPSAQVSQNSIDLEEKGDVQNANTWLATLLNRLTQALRS